MTMGTRLCSRLAVLGVAAALALTAGADPSSPTVLRGFERSGQYMLHANGKAIPDARIYYSRRAAAYLVLSDVFESGVLVLPRTRCVESVSDEEMTEHDDESIDVKKNTTPCSLGRYRLEGPDVVFRVGKIRARLKPKPPLLGGHLAAALIEHTPEYLRDGRAYKPDPKLMKVLEASKKEARIQIFFGSWCSFCSRFLPNVLKVERLLKGKTKLHFEYFGLQPPPAAWVSPTATKMGIRKLPTGIIFIDDKEVGRIVGTEWIRPERYLVKYLK
ncbi:MAG: thioredoxin family protein [Planctomycetota bacterium]